ncbi:MAG: hypothetical protein Kow0042_26880 [Calditrichia bacterium]
MRRIWIKIIGWLLITAALGFSQEVRYGNLPQLISQIRSAMPGQNSYAFVVPTQAQMDSFRAVTNLILTEQYYLADSLAQMMDYQLYQWYDTASNNELFYVLMEPNANQSGGVQLGWGTFVFNPDGQQEVIIEVPHPYFDTNTWEVGFAAYQMLDSRFFLMAGTHRYANGTNPRPADVAHNTQNMFHVVHQQVSPLCTHSLQVHGFSRNNHPGYPDIVLSNGTPNPGPILDSLETEFNNAGYTVGIFDGINWTALGATTNTQGQWSNSLGYSFIHMELESFIRLSQTEWENIVDALYNVFYLPLAIPQEADAIIPDELVLYPNYPNPFNPSTTIRYYLPRRGEVNVEIFNIRGERVRVLLKETQSAGEKNLMWYGRDDRGLLLPSGTYFVRVKTFDQQTSRKLHLVK